MIKRILFKGICFENIRSFDFNKIIKKKGLFVFPSGPGLASIDSSPKYHNSLKKADLVFFDSGFFVLLLRFFKNIKVNKFSGYKFLNFFFIYLRNNDVSIFCIDPNKKVSKSNKKYFNKLGVKKIYSYLAPIYNPEKIIDKQLLKKINKFKPNFIITNIGGGTQEILGLYLITNLKIKTTILCTGGAISYFTGEQAPIINLIDKLYLGWLTRIIFYPIIFLKRYFFAFRLLPIVLRSKVKVKIDR
tara:strand:+ start:662 stop:1396 length:735 start_codon:yes stop_codon:yes gene_type:complete